MTPETLRLLRDLLAAQTLNVGAEDFPDVARRVTAALAELDAALTPAAPGEVVGGPR